jgi:uncharacterized protein
MWLVNVDEFIGKGWRFPIKLNAKGGIDWSEGPARISDAIWIIVKTALAERVMRPTFGAGVNEYVFQSNSFVIRTKLVAAVKSALVKWEPRIEIGQVQAQPLANDPTQVLISIEYRIRTTNELFNVVYPFYLEEGIS